MNNKKGITLVLILLALGIILYILFISLGRRTKPDFLSMSNSLKNKVLDPKFLGSSAKFIENDMDINADGYTDVFAYREGSPEKMSLESTHPLFFRDAMILQLENKKYKKILQITPEKISGLDGKPLLQQLPARFGYLAKFDTMGKKCVIELIQSDSNGHFATNPLILEWNKDKFHANY